VDPQNGADQNTTGVAEELLTVKEYAYLFGYHPNSVWRRVRAGKMPNAIRDGRSIRIRVPSELVARLRAHPKKTPGDE
jgi:predicted DNA-binding transcriptional regulator AlpA